MSFALLWSLYVFKCDKLDRSATNVQPHAGQQRGAFCVFCQFGRVAPCISYLEHSAYGADMQCGHSQACGGVIWGDCPHVLEVYMCGSVWNGPYLHMPMHSHAMYILLPDFLPKGRCSIRFSVRVVPILFILELRTILATPVLLAPNPTSMGRDVIRTTPPLVEVCIAVFVATWPCWMVPMHHVHASGPLSCGFPLGRA